MKGLKETLSQFLLEKNCKLAYLVGSYARSSQLPMSDLDLVISYPDFNKLSPNDKLAFLSEIVKVANQSTKIQEVDVSIIENLPVIIQFSMMRDGILLFEAEPGYSSVFMENLMNVYYDLVLWYENFLNIALESD